MKLRLFLAERILRIDFLFGTGGSVVYVRFANGADRMIDFRYTGPVLAVQRSWERGAIKVKPDGPSAGLKNLHFAVPKSPAAEAGRQYCDFEAGLPGVVTKEDAEDYFLDRRSRPAPIHPR